MSGMDQDPNRSPSAEAASPGPVGAEAGDAFALWLEHSLHALYDGVTAEPIPPELLRLIEQDRSRRGR